MDHLLINTGSEFQKKLTEWNETLTKVQTDLTRSQQDFEAKVQMFNDWASKELDLPANRPVLQSEIWLKVAAKK